MAIVDFDITGTSFTAVYEDLKRLLKTYREHKAGSKIVQNCPPGS